MKFAFIFDCNKTFSKILFYSIKEMIIKNDNNYFYSRLISDIQIFNNSSQNYVYLKTFFEHFRWNDVVEYKP